MTDHDFDLVSLFLKERIEFCNVFINGTANNECIPDEVLKKREEWIEAKKQFEITLGMWQSYLNDVPQLKNTSKEDFLVLHSRLKDYIAKGLEHIQECKKVGFNDKNTLILTKFFRAVSVFIDTY